MFHDINAIHHGRWVLWRGLIAAIGVYGMVATASAATVIAQIMPTLASDVKLRADRLISVFENSTLTIQYAYIEALGDDRGYTAGRAGFTTATGDALIVVDTYTQRVPDNGLKPYLKELRRLAAIESGDIKGLKGFPTAWKTAAKDAKFRAVQDEVSDRLYFQPAMQHAKVLGATLNLTKVALYEAIIQHGDGDDPDSLGAILQRATLRAGGTPATKVPEKSWLKAFLDERRADLLNPYDPDTTQEWGESVGRADEMLRIWASGNVLFKGPMKVNPFGDPFTIP